MAKLLLIESPGKLKKLSQILGPGWIVKASMGHIRELTNEGEDALGFDLGEDRITCQYAPRDARAKKTIAGLRQAVRQADTVYIATDPDREGETIGWHLQQALRLKSPRRVVYSEITPDAVRRAVANPRTLDQALVAAGRARDCLDKLVGYKGSRHVVWPLNNGAKSMGRVQSAALHLLCQREREIQQFQPVDYWSVSVAYEEGFKAFYKRSPNAAKPQARRADDAKEKSTAESERVRSQAEADRLVAIANSNPHQILTIEGTIKRQSPPAPFITSTLQQSAGSKLRFAPEHTMQVAQSLYEGGHITYMRTDSVVLAAPFCAAVKTYLSQRDPDNVPKTATKHRARKGTQAAHEAIRPTDVTATPTQLGNALSADAQKLYSLIWHRAVASQCCPARLRKTRIVTQSGPAYWEARGQVVEFAGYTRYWNNLSAEAQIPTLQQGQAVRLQQAQSEQKQTQPPPRYSEPKLVQQMERRGIGRPSTYAPTIKTLRTRTYVHLLKGKLQPTELGLALDSALERLLPNLVEPDFTAKMEADLDQIAAGKQDWESYLIDWHRDYFGPAIEQAKHQLDAEQMTALRAGSLGPTIEASAKAQCVSRHPPRLKTQVTSRDEQPKKIGKASKQSTHKQSTVVCPQCQQPLSKIPSRSKKLKANHFLKCKSPGCDTVMFWNPVKKAYELPYAKRAVDPNAFTDYPCPSCGALLIKHDYCKDGKDKVMLRCSISKNRQETCQDVAFFESRSGGWWSPKYGNLQVESTSASR